MDALRNRDAILFVGAGVSMNVGLPSWRKLVEEIATRVGYDPDIFSQLGDHLSLAEYYFLLHGSLGKLRSWMDTEWHSGEHRTEVESSEIHKMLVGLPFNIIYTTNYDRYIEWACEAHGREYTKITNVGDLVHVKDQKLQIIKFHGDFEDDQSIVLTESSYFERLGFESPIFLTRPNPVQEAVLRSRGIEPIISPTDDPRQGLATFLSELHTRLK